MTLESSVLTKCILVVSKNPELAETTRRAVEGRYPVDYAPDQGAATRYLEKKHPDVIVIGYLDSPQSFPSVL